MTQSCKPGPSFKFNFLVYVCTNVTHPTLPAYRLTLQFPIKVWPFWSHFHWDCSSWHRKLVLISQLITQLLMLMTDSKKTNFVFKLSPLIILPIRNQSQYHYTFMEDSWVFHSSTHGKTWALNHAWVLVGYFPKTIFHNKSSDFTML